LTTATTLSLLTPSASSLTQPQHQQESHHHSLTNHKQHKERCNKGGGDGGITIVNPKPETRNPKQNTQNPKPVEIRATNAPSPIDDSWCLNQKSKEETTAETEQKTANAYIAEISIPHTKNPNPNLHTPAPNSNPKHQTTNQISSVAPTLNTKQQTKSHQWPRFAHSRNLLGNWCICGRGQWSEREKQRIGCAGCNSMVQFNCGMMQFNGAIQL